MLASGIKITILQSSFAPQASAFLRTMFPLALGVSYNKWAFFAI